MKTIELRWKTSVGNWSCWVPADHPQWRGRDVVPDGVKLLLTDMEPGFHPVNGVTVKYGHSIVPDPTRVKTQYRLKKES